MGYASQAGRAKTSSRNPQAHAICDRCGFRYNWVNLRWQYDWRGATLQNIRILVCDTCYDTPQEQLRAIVVPADPTPIINARVQDFALAETDNFTISTPTVYDPITGIPIPPTTNIVTQDGNNLNTQVIGVPVGLDANAVMPLYGQKHYRVLLPVISVVSIGTTIITVTCSAVHSLNTGDQVSILGLTKTGAEGFYTVTVVTATAFTYMTTDPIPAGSLLTPQTQVA
jgi:hypothetical protein